MLRFPKRSNLTASKSVKGVVRVRRVMGSLEGHERQKGGDVLDPDHDPKCCDLTCP